MFIQKLPNSCLEGLNGSMSPATLTLVSSFCNKYNVTKVDLTGSMPGTDLRYLENIKSLQSLVLDSCGLNDHFICPSTPSLTTLRANEDAHLASERKSGLLKATAELSPEANPTQSNLIIEMELDYQRYRCFVFTHGKLPKLQFLDAQAIGPRDRIKGGPWLGTTCTGPETLQASDGPHRGGCPPHGWAASKERGPLSKDLGTLAWQLWNATINELSLKTKSTTSQNLEMCEIRDSKARRDYQIESATSPFDTMDSTSPTSTVEHGKSFFGKLKYRYSGNNSEGNRFIRNQDL
eukprot:maker-scaffold449_size167299-snap-gene-0.19 protein:Tk10591 transcript:maker-scaffold449_size167299-snap-gene-0.19-mRNA-1 annotation:"leucine-rich repeat-containing protein c10orf11 homolog isoform x1"